MGNLTDIVMYWVVLSGWANICKARFTTVLLNAPSEIKPGYKIHGMAIALPFLVQSDRGTDVFGLASKQVLTH